MIVLIPVSRFRVPYDAARGRPYSPLERLVLEAVAGDGSTLEDLRRTFRVHERLLVEAVVTLVNVGWVAVAAGAKATFVLTAAGQAATDNGQDPISVVVTTASPQTLVMERVSGQLARTGDARSWRKDDLGEAWESSVAMRERIVRNSLDESQVQKLLAREPGQWVRQIGPIRLLSRGTHFVAVEVEPSTGQVRGLPAAWTEGLTDLVVDCARGRAAQDEGSAHPPTRHIDTSRSSGGRRFSITSQRTSMTRTTHVNTSKVDLLVGREDHEAGLVVALEKAFTSIAIVSPSASDAESFKRVVDLALPAIDRGVRVDFLLGTTPEEVVLRDLVDVARTSAYDVDPREGRSLLRTRGTPTGSGASLLVYDQDDGPLTAVIGNHSWLTPADSASPSISLRLTEASLAADVARAVASLWIGRGPADITLAGPAERWRQLAAGAEESAARTEVGQDTGSREAGLNSSAELFVDDEHAGMVSVNGGVATVGAHAPDPQAGDAARRGVSLRVTGTLAELVRAARENPFRPDLPGQRSNVT